MEEVTFFTESWSFEGITEFVDPEFELLPPQLPTQAEQDPEQAGAEDDEEEEEEKQKEPDLSGVEWITGRWDLQSSENLDAFLTAEGLPWIVRRAAAVLPETQYIKLNVSDGTIESQVSMTPKPTFGQRTKLDGKTAVKYRDMEDTECLSVYSVTECGMKVIDSIFKPNHGGDKDMQRTLERGTGEHKGLLKMTVMRKKDGIFAVRYFKRSPLMESDWPIKNRAQSKHFGDSRYQ